MRSVIKSHASHSLSAALVAVALFSINITAHADSLRETFNTGAFSTTASFEDTFAVNGFNPALGMLTAVSVDFSGSFTVAGISGSNDKYSNVNFFISTPGSNLSIVRTQQYFTQSNGNFAASAFGTDTYGPALAAFTSASTVNPSFDVSEDGGATDSSSGFAGTVTYTYTPASAAAVTPEPSSIALLGTGLLGAVGVVRKRLA